MKRRLLITFLALLVLATAAYFGICAIVYARLATVLPQCAGEFEGYTPAAFSAEHYRAELDVSAYVMPTYEAITIPSRDPKINLSAWFVPADEPEAPTVLITHGRGVGVADCKWNPRALLPAGMLHRAGYHVLLIDLREHGDSTIEDGFWAANTEEYRDVLGAWDWLVKERGLTPERIGLFGYSGGTGASLIAMGQEPRIAAAWLDSVYADINTAVTDMLVAGGYPAFLAPGGLLIARLHGDDLTAFSPQQAAATINGRPIFITHSENDPVLPVKYAYQLEAALRAGGTNPTLWITHNEGHVRAMFEDMQAYEQRLIAFFDSALKPTPNAK
ncbi:MAG TPA: prolyl oligopeptidase family serine peptidase [Phototrophicaceae bacterium]|nr:prolyl oligopeptidase family serine peptidase [Phototrophicaceae bacterium]